MGLTDWLLVVIIYLLYRILYWLAKIYERQVDLHTLNSTWFGETRGLVMEELLASRGNLENIYEHVYALVDRSKGAKNETL